MMLFLIVLQSSRTSFRLSGVLADEIVRNAQISQGIYEIFIHPRPALSLTSSRRPVAGLDLECRRLDQRGLVFKAAAYAQIALRASIPPLYSGPLCCETFRMLPVRPLMAAYE